MTRIAIAALTALCLAGCATATQEKVLTNLEGCTRFYDGSVSGGLMGAGFVGTVKIECPPVTRPLTIDDVTP